MKENKEIKINYNNKGKNEIEKNNNEKENIEDIKPLVIDANKDEFLNYLISLNDSLMKKINSDIQFDEIYQFFTNYALEKIENFINSFF